jgi:hypothetical protein
MANAGTATISKQPDGDINFGSKQGELVTLSDAPSSYPTGGYPIMAGANFQNQINAGLTPIGQNVDLWKVDTIQAWGQNLGYTPEWDTVYQKLRFYSGNAEVANGTDLSGIVFSLCIIGT